MPVQPPRTYAQDSLSDPVALVPRANEEPGPEREGSISPASSVRNDTSIHEKLPVLSHMNPRRGSTKGGYEIYLVVRNLPPTALLYARFGCNLAPTVSRWIGSDPTEFTDTYLQSHIAPGVLSCILPTATRPGAVDVTLCEAPSAHEEGYGKSLVSFEYEFDTPEASVFFSSLPVQSVNAASASLLLGGTALMEAMPLIEGLFMHRIIESVSDSIADALGLEVLAL